MQHEPCGLLRDAQIAGELHASDAFLVAGDQPDRNEPLAQWQFRVSEDRADLYREPLPACLALVCTTVGEVVDFGRAAIWAERAARPADRAEVLDASLLVRERCRKFRESVECLQHARLQPTRAFYPLAFAGSSTYIITLWRMRDGRARVFGRGPDGRLGRSEPMATTKSGQNAGECLWRAQQVLGNRRKS